LGILKNETALDSWINRPSVPEVNFPEQDNKEKRKLQCTTI